MFRHLCTTLSHPAIIGALCRRFPIAGLHTRAAFRYLNMLEPLKCDRIYLISPGGLRGRKKNENPTDEELIILSLTIQKVVKSVTNLCYEQAYETF